MVLPGVCLVVTVGVHSAKRPCDASPTPSLWRSGVGDVSPHLNGHTVVQVQDCRYPFLCYPSPAYRGFGQTGRT